MSAKQILVPTDFSDYSLVALEHATALALDHDASLLIVHVKPPPDHYTVAGGFAAVPLPIDEAPLHHALAECRPTDQSVGYSQRMLAGDTIEEIVAVAEQEHVEMIVMGTHGRTGLGHLLIGSIAEGVVRRAPCPVLTVKKPVEEGAVG